MQIIREFKHKLIEVSHFKIGVKQLEFLNLEVWKAVKSEHFKYPCL